MPNIFCFTLQMALRALGFVMKKAEVLRILENCDREENGKINFLEFKDVSK